MSRAEIETAPTDERAALEVRASEAARGARECAERIERIKTRKAELVSEAEKPGADVEALAAEGATLSAQLPMAEAALRGAERTRVEIEGQLAGINLARTISTLDTRCAGIEGTAASNAAAVKKTIETLSGLVHEWQALLGEHEMVRRQLSQYGRQVGQLPRIHDVVEEAARAIRARGRTEPLELRVPVPY